MRTAGVLLLLLVVASSLVGCGAAGVGPGGGPAGGPGGDAIGVTWVRDGSYVVLDGARQVGVLVVSGGDVRLAPGSRADGPVLLLGGTLTIDGLVTGDVLAPGGDLILGPFAAVRGELGVGGGFERHPEALVTGAVTTGLGIPADLGTRRGGDGWRVLWQALATAAWAAAWARGAPRRLRAMGDAATRHAPVALSLGALVFVIGLIAAVVMAFTIVLIPASLLLLGIGFLAVGTGWAALGHALGGALARGPLRRWSAFPVRLAAAGGFMVALLLGLVERVPWVGGAVALVVAVTALGAVALTGLGGRPFVHAGDAASAEPVA
jgi:hypothetical protein